MAVTKHKAVWGFAGSVGNLTIGSNKTDDAELEAVSIVGPENGGDDLVKKSIDDMKVTELKAYLTQIGVEYDAGASKAELIELAKA